MSGHFRWAITRRKKVAIDAKRGKLFVRLIKDIEVAARTGGGDPTGNPTLSDAIQKAKENSVPTDNIIHAVKHGSGEEASGADWQTIMYKGYDPGGVAFLVECLTDNRNRAASDVRVAFSRNGGNLTNSGPVAYNFTRKGVVEVAKADGVDEDSILMAALKAGAEGVEDVGESLEIYSEPGDIAAIRTTLTEAGMDYDSAEVQSVAGMKVEVDVEGVHEVFHLIDVLEDSDDVQNVYTSVDLSPEVAAEFASDED